VQFVKVEFDTNKAMSRSLGVKVLPFFQLYRGSTGRVAEFSASLSKVQRLRDALDEHGGPRCVLGPPVPPALVRCARCTRAARSALTRLRRCTPQHAAKGAAVLSGVSYSS
jgi:hypothetical protein